MPHFRYDSIVFDFDGTLVKSKEIKALAFGKLYEEHGVAIVQQVIAYHREHEGLSRFVKFRYWHEHLLHQPYTDEIAENLSRSYSRLVHDAVIQAPYVEGALEFLESHHQSLPLFVASGTPEPELRKIIACRSMNRFFQGVYGSPATKAQILQRILSEHQLGRERVLMVGDTLADWEGARCTGIVFLGIEKSCDTQVLPEGPHLPNLKTLESFLNTEDAMRCKPHAARIATHPFMRDE